VTLTQEEAERFRGSSYFPELSSDWSETKKELLKRIRKKAKALEEICRVQ